MNHDLSFLNNKPFELKPIIQWLQNDCKQYEKYQQMFNSFFELPNDDYTIQFTKIQLSKSMKESILIQLYYSLLKKKLFKKFKLTKNF